MYGNNWITRLFFLPDCLDGLDELGARSCVMSIPAKKGLKVLARESEAKKGVNFASC